MHWYIFYLFIPSCAHWSITVSHSLGTKHQVTTTTFQWLLQFYLVLFPQSLTCLSVISPAATLRWERCVKPRHQLSHLQQHWGENTVSSHQLSPLLQHWGVNTVSSQDIRRSGHLHKNGFCQDLMEFSKPHSPALVAVSHGRSAVVNIQHVHKIWLNQLLRPPKQVLCYKKH